MVGTCDVGSADGCCGVIPCKLCLEWETYEGGISYGSADFATSSWTGTVGGGSFVAYWERSAYDECEFVVTLDGDEFYRATCQDGASCRNPSGEVSAAIGYDEGTLRWSVYEPRELQLTEDPDTGCRDFFCGSCRCSCDCLCVTITDATGDITTGEICDVSYPCDAPVWEGSVGYYELSIALGRDEYGDCIITLTIDGDEQDPVTVTGCADMSATVTLYDGTTIAVSCKQCACAEDFPCCPGMTFPDTLSLTLISMNTECVCIDGQVIPMELSSQIGGRVYYTAIWAMTCVLNGDPSQQRWHLFQMNCGAGDVFPTVLVSYMQIAAGDTPTGVTDPRWSGTVFTWDKTSGQCDPFYFRFASTGGAGSSGNTQVWGNCGESSMDTPWIEFEVTL